MEKYNKILKNLAELVEKGLFSSKDLKKDIESSLKFIVENIVNKLNLVSREEFEIQKKIIEKIIKNKVNKSKKKKTKKTKKS